MKQFFKILLLLLIGSVSGFVNGFFGGGGGMIVVPLLSLVLKLPTKKSHATAIAIIFPISLVSGITYLLVGSFNKTVGLPVCGGVIIGGILGALLLKKMKSRIVSKLFAFVVLAAGVKLLFL